MHNAPSLSAGEGVNPFNSPTRLPKPPAINAPLRFGYPTLSKQNMAQIQTLQQDQPTMNPKIVVLATAACALALPALAQTSSGTGRTVVYTETSGKTCKTLSNQGGGEIVEWKCRGVGRDPFFIDAITLGGVAFGKDGENEPGFTPTQEFTGKKIEWRLQDGQPYATIFRAFVNVEVQSTPVPKWIPKQVLVVTKLDGENACHIAYVDAGIRNANAKAAEIADANASSFTCGSDKPLRVGNPPAFRD